ncbi:hypothetical protein [Gaetbulibacter jejuensis]|uniref:hypothetical protein n=1 Tax=Gaetbulibacter jejuensis TaxID=584607 RepID=UPI00300AFB8A
MNKSKAIDILKNQINKLDVLKPYNTNNWITQTSTYLDTFFGANSHQHSYFKYLDIKSEGKKKEVSNFLQDCIEIISNKGLHKPPKQYLLSRIPDWSIIPIVSGLLIIGSAFGRYQKDISFIRMENELKTLKDSISTISSNYKTNNTKKINDNPKIK